MVNWVIYVATMYVTALFSLFTCSDRPPSAADPSVTSLDGANAPDTTVITALAYEVIQSYPHDTDAFTQGLSVMGNTIYESTGNYGKSAMRSVTLQTGEVKQTRHLSSTLFGEGLALFDDKIIQLTWKSGVGFIYDRTNFELLRSVSYPGEGWGITYDGDQFVMSDGSATLYFRDKVTFEETRKITVRDNNGHVRHLNELEYVKGEIYANIWQEDRIVRINPINGEVTGWIDLTGLLKPEAARLRADVLNGIAYDGAGDRLFVTGKWWPRLYQIRLIDKEKL